MREVLHLTDADVRILPWKNGRGITEELAIWPDGATLDRGDFEWRISKAAVDDSGPFSAFPGFDRLLVVTDGDGFVLTHGDHAPRARVRRFEPYLFAGDWPTSAELLRGKVSDFNVLLRRGRWRANIEVLKLGRRRAREALAAGHAFVHVLSGELVARVTAEEEPFALEENESLWARELTGGDELDLAGTSDDCVALLVQIGRTDEDDRE
jgi:environmental stress-induced protein Ves